MRLSLCLIILLISIITISAQEEGEGEVWIPMDPATGATTESDWVQLSNGEW